MSAVRPDIALLEQNGITGVAMPRLNDPSVIPLWFGEGDRVTPDFIRQAAIDALNDGKTFYVNTRGTDSLRDEIQAYHQRIYGIDLEPDRITVPGSTMLGVTIAAQISLSSDRHAVIVSPHWPNIETAVRVTGAEFSIVRQRETSTGWELTADEIMDACLENTRLIYLNSPCNPTGWVMDRSQQQQLLDFCREREIMILADEVYHRLVYDADVAPSFLEIARPDDPVIVVNGLSKSWAMTGWRIGWVVTPISQTTTWKVMTEAFNTGATVFVQDAAAVALRDGEPTVAEFREHYLKGREILMEVLGDHPGLKLSKPEGAFYAFPSVKGVTSSLKFAQQVLAEEDVGIAPGYTFGEGNESHFRVCFAQSHDRLREGLERITRYIERHNNNWD